GREKAGPLLVTRDCYCPGTTMVDSSAHFVERWRQGVCGWLAFGYRRRYSLDSFWNACLLLLPIIRSPSHIHCRRGAVPHRSRIQGFWNQQAVQCLSRTLPRLCCSTLSPSEWKYLPNLTAKSRISSGTRQH